MTPEQAGLLALMFLLILIGIGTIVWFITSVANDQKKKTETVRRAKQDAIDQVIRDSKLGASRIWSYDDSTVTHIAKEYLRAYKRQTYKYQRKTGL